MMLENVEEFKTWGPLLEDEMRPDPARTGETFAAFVGMLSTGINANHPALAEVCEFLSIQPDSEQARSLIQGLGYHIDYRELRACDFGRQQSANASLWSCAATVKSYAGQPPPTGIRNHWKCRAADWRHGELQQSALTGRCPVRASLNVLNHWRRIRLNALRAVSSVLC
jgi:hypothetical protein